MMELDAEDAILESPPICAVQAELGSGILRGKPACRSSRSERRRDGALTSPYSLLSDFAASGAKPRKAQPAARPNTSSATGGPNSRIGIAK
jgi:hypothetical protein